jgi:hypothetical protein
VLLLKVHHVVWTTCSCLADQAVIVPARHCLNEASWCIQELGQALASFPSPSHTAEEGGHVDWEGADFVIGDVCDTLRLMRAEHSLLK